MCAGPLAYASDVEVGIGDQSADMLSEPAFKDLGIETARVVLPWDVAVTDPARLRGWALTARNEGVEPLLALEHRRGDRCPDSPCALPSDAAYLDAFRAIRARFPWIRTFTPWNEPNHSSQPTADDPAAAAHFANLLADDCPDCTIVAGDMLDAPGFTGYVADYRRALTFTPTVWALHNYYDSSYFEDSATTAFLESVDGPVWITESGGIVTWRSADGETRMPYDEARAAASVQWAIDLAASHADRIGRLYLYQWRAGANDDFDAGLMEPSGPPRPAYYVLRDALAPRLPGRPALLKPISRTLRPSVRLRGARLDRDGRLRVRVACRVARCSGQVSVAGVGWAAERYVNGRLAPAALAPRRARFSLPPRVAKTIVVALPRRITAIARRRGIALRLTASPRRRGEAWGARARVRLRVPRR